MSAARTLSSLAVRTDSGECANRLVYGTQNAETQQSRFVCLWVHATSVWMHIWLAIYVNYVWADKCVGCVRAMRNGTFTAGIGEELWINVG